MSKLDFQVVSNNDVTLKISCLTSSGATIDATSLGLSVKWQWLVNTGTITKTSSGGDIAFISLNPLTLGISIDANDTKNVLQGYYYHEAVTVDGSGNAVTITNNDPVLSAGLGFIRKQKVAQ